MNNMAIRYKGIICHHPLCPISWHLLQLTAKRAHKETKIVGGQIKKTIIPNKIFDVSLNKSVEDKKDIIKDNINIATIAR